MKRFCLIMCLLVSSLVMVCSPVQAMSPCEAYLEAINTKVVWIIQPLQPFQSVEELQVFLNSYHVKTVWQIDVDNMPPLPLYNCKNYAFALRDYARSNGYDIETECFHKGDMILCLNHKLTEEYAACKAYIGNEVYVIDPVTLSYWIEWLID
ncbi:MAG: hypothetical protein MUO97_05920 [Dehalococcoidia bacterium]|nr:hypothetical protein [Dehalococcoidia bacterium]